MATYERLPREIRQQILFLAVNSCETPRYKNHVEDELEAELLKNHFPKAFGRQWRSDGTSTYAMDSVTLTRGLSVTCQSMRDDLLAVIPWHCKSIRIRLEACRSADRILESAAPGQHHPWPSHLDTSCQPSDFGRRDNEDLTDWEWLDDCIEFINTEVTGSLHQELVTMKSIKGDIQKNICPSRPEVLIPILIRIAKANFARFQWFHQSADEGLVNRELADAETIVYLIERGAVPREIALPIVQWVNALFPSEGNPPGFHPPPLFSKDC
ncbi:MAG: hypothetical protein M1831_006091 [Alyxoria varia]|nr:MAG: hypothetical protein M1831_006091 [Alyxoria varia]